MLQAMQVVLMKSKGDGSWRFTSNVSGGRTGFANLGNTCYLNSGLQAIIHVPQIIAIFGQQRVCRALHCSAELGRSDRRPSVPESLVHHRHAV